MLTCFKNSAPLMESDNQSADSVPVSSFSEGDRRGGIAITVKGKKLFLEFQEIVKFESFGHDIYIHTEGGVHIVHTPLSEIEKGLTDEFIRISQSVIVRKSLIRRRGPYLAGRCFITLHDGSEATVTRTYYKKFKEEMIK